VPLNTPKTSPKIVDDALRFPNKVYVWDDDGELNLRVGFPPEGARCAEYTINNEGYCKHIISIEDKP
jgi:hypothetical protein